MAKLKVAVIISGRGSNMGALARATMNPDYPAEIVMVLSNRPHAPGLELAREHGIRIRVVDHKEFSSPDEHQQALHEALVDSGAQLVCLAGYMRILGDWFINQWRGNIINIHPSLLPSFRGLGTHERALERGVRIHGASVHYVNTELDGGPIIAQAAVPVEVGDTAETLGARVLEAEHKLYPKALALIAAKKVRWSRSEVVVDDDVEQDEISLFL